MENMKKYLEKAIGSKKGDDLGNVATALLGNHLCLFLGTGFSIFLTENKKLGWLDVLDSSLEILDDENTINAIRKIIDNAKSKPKDNKISLSPELIAEMIICHCRNQDPIILKNKIKKILSPLKANEKRKEAFENFLTVSKNNRLEILTTNFDKLIEDICGDNCSSFSYDSKITSDPIHPIIYHLHGHINDEKNIVITKDDYLNWASESNYFKNKAYTIFNERAILFCGYSLSDYSILSFLKKYHIKIYNKHDHYFFSKTKIDPIIKKHFYDNYRLLIIDGYDNLGDFFQALVNSFNDLNNKPTIQSEDFYKTLISSINTEDFISYINKKVKLTKQPGAWEQYTHLSIWLSKILSVYKLNDLPKDHKEILLNATSYSFNNMSKDLVLGCSWASYKIWMHSKFDILKENIELIKEKIYSEEKSIAFDNYKEIFETEPNSDANNLNT